MKKFNLACLVDDDEIFVFGAKRIIELSNFCDNLMIFPNGKEALDYIKAEKNVPDVVLLDLNMPIMDGWEFLDEITKIERLEPILIYIISSSISPLDIERAKTYEVVSKYIIKPISKGKLMEIMNE